LLAAVRSPAATQQEEQTRWAALTAHQLLGRYEKEFEALIQAFGQKKSVAECIAAVEAAE
jgi:hypothetical protein